MNEHAHIPIVAVWRLVDDPCARQPSRDYTIREYTSTARPSPQLSSLKMSPQDTFVSILPYILTAAFSPPYPLQTVYMPPDPANSCRGHGRFPAVSGWPGAWKARGNISPVSMCPFSSITDTGFNFSTCSPLNLSLLCLLETILL